MLARALLYPDRLKIEPRAVLACLLSALALTAVLAPAPAQARGSARLDGVERKIVGKINAIRAGYGLPRLLVSRRLARSADYHSRDMLRANFFAHSSSNGQSMQRRVKSFRRSKRIGETLAYVRGRSSGRSARRIVRMWMNSPPHRASLLNPGFRRVGVARRTGRLGRGRATVFTADFASRR